MNLGLIGSEMLSEDEAKETMNMTKDISLLLLTVMFASILIGLITPSWFVLTGLSGMFVVISQQKHAAAQVVYHVLRTRKR